MGLAQREIEAAGIATITLSSLPEVTASVGAPRVAAIGYPLGLPLGKPGDREGQTAVLQALLIALEQIREPGGVVHLSFEWDGKPPRLEPPEPPPIAQLLMRKPWLYPKLVAGQFPD